MIDRTDIAALTWNDKPVSELSRDELIDLVHVLHGLVWASSENFERLASQQMRQAEIAGNA